MFNPRFKSIVRTRSWRVLLPTVIALVGVTGIGVAAIPSTGGVITSCYSTGKSAPLIALLGQPGQLRVIDAEAGAKCSAHEKALSFNQAGPAGPKGDTGPKGDEGDAGVSAAYSARGTSIQHESVAASASVPAGSYVVDASISARNRAGENATLVCRLQVNTNDIDESSFIRLAPKDSLGDVHDFPLQGVIADFEGGDIEVTCVRGLDDDGVIVRATVTAIAVSSVQ